MIINTKYELLEEIKLKDLEINGKIIEICLTKMGFSYFINYLWNGEKKNHLFYEDEIKKLN